MIPFSSNTPKGDLYSVFVFANHTPCKKQNIDKCITKRNAMEWPQGYFIGSAKWKKNCAVLHAVKSQSRARLIPSLRRHTYVYRFIIQQKFLFGFFFCFIRCCYFIINELLHVRGNKCAAISFTWELDNKQPAAFTHTNRN